MDYFNLKPRPTLETRRLVLRPFTLDDAPVVRQLAGAREIARMTTHIPHPYEDGMAEEWIKSHQALFEYGTHHIFAIVLCGQSQLCGAIALVVNAEHLNAELGYWIGVPFWGRGYCTEAASTVIGYAFGQLRLHRVHAACFACNASSRHVLQKIGMTHEGTLRDHVKKWDRFEDVEKYAILARE